MKNYAPRLYNKKVRVDIGLEVAPEIKEGLRKIARSERRSMSWVIEQLLNDILNFGIRYKEKNKRSK